MTGIKERISGEEASGVKTASVLGSTGSVGKTTLEILEEHGGIEIVALSAHRDVETLEAQARKFRPSYVAMADRQCALELKKRLAKEPCRVLAGPEGVIEAACCRADWVMAAIVGIAGLAPVLAALRGKTKLALANKEALVCAGPLLLAEAARHDSLLLPVDSEHNGVFQLLEAAGRGGLEKITLTASGGPFLHMPAEKIAHVTPKQACAHPVWGMGRKISVDSATMANKVLELIEAQHFFSLRKNALDVVIHPQSVIHALVHYADGAVLAHMGPADMRLPVRACLYWPQRGYGCESRLDLAALGKLTFESVCKKRFPMIRLGAALLEDAGAAPIIFNAANEVAVAAFLEEKIAYETIAATVEETLCRMCCETFPDALDAILDLDRAARATARGLVACKRI